MTKRVISFGSYLFPDTQDQLSDNFTNVVNRSVRLPDLSGAFDELGLEPGPTETGSLKVKFLLLAAHSQQITQLRDDVRAMAGWGLRKLLVQPADPTLAPRYTYARIQNIGVPENAKRLDIWQEVNVDFFVPYPRWMQDAATGTNWGEGTWGGFVWGGTWPWVNVGSAAVGPGEAWGSATWGSFVWGAGQVTDLTVTNTGNAISLPRLEFLCTDPVASGLIVERVINGLAMDTLTYSGAIAVGQILSLDARGLSVTLDGDAAYNSFDYTHPAWLRLSPGANTLRVTLPSGGGKLKIVYPHTWY
jgi:hypothetical protein